MMWLRSPARIAIQVSCDAAVLAACSVADARPRRRGPSPAQIKAKQEQVASMQLEMVRSQGEQSKFDKLMNDIQSGKAPNPFAVLAAPDHEEPGSAGRK